jgi:hypothetical protein
VAGIQQGPLLAIAASPQNELVQQNKWYATDSFAVPVTCINEQLHTNHEHRMVPTTEFILLQSVLFCLAKPKSAKTGQIHIHKITIFTSFNAQLIHCACSKMVFRQPLKPFTRASMLCPETTSTCMVTRPLRNHKSCHL